jgi:hypothetical protein
MPHVDSNISDSAKFGGINSLFSRFLMLYSSKGFFIVQMINLISVLRRKVTLHRNELEVCLPKEEFISQLCNSFFSSIVSMKKFLICMKCLGQSCFCCGTLHLLTLTHSRCKHFLSQSPKFFALHLHSSMLSKVYQGPTFSGKGIYRSRMFLLLGPSHHHYTHKCALSTAFIYKTPIGDLPIDLEDRPTIHTHRLDATVS